MALESSCLACIPNVGGGSPRSWEYIIHSRFDGYRLTAVVRGQSVGLQNKGLAQPVVGLGEGEEILMVAPAETLELTAISTNHPRQTSLSGGSRCATAVNLPRGVPRPSQVPCLSPCRRRSVTGCSGWTRVLRSKAAANGLPKARPNIRFSVGARAPSTSSALAPAFAHLKYSAILLSSQTGSPNHSALTLARMVVFHC